jgi:hypothetical protein
MRKPLYPPQPDRVVAWAHAEIARINQRRYARTHQIEALIEQQRRDNDAVALIRRKLAERQGLEFPRTHPARPFVYASLPWEERLAMAQRRWARLTDAEREHETRQQHEATRAAVRWLETNRVAA